MGVFVLILTVAAFVLLLLAALNIPSPARVSLGWAGLACWAMVELLLRVGTR